MIMLPNGKHMVQSYQRGIPYEENKGIESIERIAQPVADVVYAPNYSISNDNKNSHMDIGGHE